MRTSSDPWLTLEPRSTGVAITRPAVSALTSACSSAVSEPVTRRNRSIARLSTVAVSTTTGAGASAAAAAAEVLVSEQADDIAPSATTPAIKERRKRDMTENLTLNTAESRNVTTTDLASFQRRDLPGTREERRREGRRAQLRGCRGRARPRFRP